MDSPLHDLGDRGVELPESDDGSPADAAAAPERARIGRHRRAARIMARHAAAARDAADVGRIVDIAGASAALLLVAPVMLMLALLIWLQDGGTPIFVHHRVGRDARAFPCLKFRSMVADAEARLEQLLAVDIEARHEWLRDHKLRDDPRITWLGRFLRGTSLDELPQLLNVLAGHMSLVGPRPIVASEIARYGRYFELYRSVRPGITGLWQISGRSDVSYRRRIALDAVYCRTKSIRLDLAILGRTVPAVLSRRGSA